MNETEFFRKLEKIDADWYLTGGRLRARHHDGLGEGGELAGTEMCPVTAVCLAEVGVLFASKYFMSAGKLMRLDWTTTMNIGFVADRMVGEWPGSDPLSREWVKLARLLPEGEENARDTLHGA